MLNNPRSTERDNQNSLRKYPFSDAASCTAETGVIPPGAIVDAQLYVPGREPGRVWMSSIDTDGKLHFSDDAGEFAELSSGAFPETAVPVVFTGDGGPCSGGVVVFGKAAYVSVLLGLAGQSFTAAQAELAPAVVSWPGLPGVLGFKLDDGHVVYGDVKIRGENGCRVATYSEGDGDGRRSYLRISAMGKTVDAVETSGFVTRVVVTSDNTTFVVSGNAASDKVVDIRATGVSTMQDDKISADQDDLCEKVREKIGTVPSAVAVGARMCEDEICGGTETTPRRITLFGHGGERVTWTDDEADSFITATTGGDLVRLLSSQIAQAPDGKRFAGYYDAAEKTPGTPLVMYYRYDGTPVRRFDIDHDVALYAHFVNAESAVTVTFDGYGTLHIAAPSDTTYSNPLAISGQENPVPSVHEYLDEVVEAGGADALSDILLHPAVPEGEVRIGLRGSNKASML